MAKTSQAKLAANSRYDKKTYDRIPFVVRRDAEINGDVIREHAASMNESTNGFLNRAVKETMTRDKEKS